MTTNPWFFSVALVSTLDRAFPRCNDNAFSVTAWALGEGLYLTDNEDYSFSICKLPDEDGNVECLQTADSEFLAIDIETINSMTQTDRELWEVLVIYFDRVSRNGLQAFSASYALATA